ncbi:DUF1150 family protein [Paracoccus aminophilus]|uniref:DUF1150 family protein n=1 Tax=Paracoccus aminophilus JCM 7686 TaxID=1367847 RepID=S5XQ82_PARAH|nr:DUF1150 family protein [Paracoccus aminophilus]AGT09534.1 hypothetical protein JCM7686_2466 [Paracoccus aminophilus JCM 7686]
MNTKFDFSQETDNTVYIRRVAVATLPQDVRDQVEGVEALYAVHGADGERIALVKDRGLAFMLARENEMSPVSVH